MNLREDISKWLFRKRGTDSANIKMRIFLLPPAGGDVSTYLNWECFVPNCVETCFVRLPGRGGRIMDEPIDDMDQMVEEIVEAIKKYIDIPYVMFGHSMGGLLVYEVTKSLNRQGLRLPEHLFLSSIKAPHLMNKFSENLVGEQGIKLYLQNNETFKKKITKLGGIPKELENDNDLFELILPTFRNDLKICETYRLDEIEKLNIPIDVFGGNRDYIASKEDLEGWKLYTDDDITFTIFQGNHFYFKDNPNILFFNLNRKMNELLMKAI